MTAGSREDVRPRSVGHELGTASAAFSHSEWEQSCSSIAEGQEIVTVRETYLQQAALESLCMLGMYCFFDTDAISDTAPWPCWTTGQALLSHNLTKQFPHIHPHRRTGTNHTRQLQIHTHL